MAKKKDNNFIDELSKLLDGKLEGLLDTLDLSDMPEEELTNLLMSTLSNPVDTMKMVADEYYSYDAPDYAAMLRPVPEPFQPLLHLMVSDLPIIEKMREVCTQFEEQTLSNELLNVFYTLLVDFLVNKKDSALEELDENEKWDFAMLVVLYLMHVNKCQCLFTAFSEALHQDMDFHLSYFGSITEDFVSILVAEMGPQFLPAWKEIMEERGVLFESKKLLMTGVAHMATLSPDALPEIQRWMADIAQACVRTIAHENLFDESLLDTLAYCCIHTHSVDAKDALISLYSKYRIPPIMVEGGSNEVRKMIKKAPLGIEEIEETLEELLTEEEDYRKNSDPSEDDYDEDGDEDDWDDGYEEEDEEEYEPLDTTYDLSDKTVRIDHMKGNKIPLKYTLRISLCGIKPEIWREIEVPSSLRLTALAVHIQRVMGWEFEHMHSIEKDDRCFNTASMEYSQGGELDGNKYAVQDLLKRVGSSILFTYDFGDGWEHKVKLVKKEDYENGEKFKVHFVDGARNCPPEDCGGVWGYQELCNAMKKPNSRSAREYIEWLGGIYDPEKFPKKRNMKK